MNRKLYEGDRMDGDIEADVSELRSLMAELPEPTEPHPAYWNNFLMRVHEQIEAESAPRKKVWWSPALIWSSLTGVAVLVAIALVTGLFPMGGGDPGTTPQLADGGAGAAVIEQPVETQSDMDLVPMDAEMQSLLADIGEVSNTDENHMVLTAEDIEMLDAIESGDDDAILEAMKSDDLVGI